MKEKEIFEALVTIQGARIRPSSLHSPRPSANSNPFVHLLVMVPKGDKDVTVPTDCITETRKRTLEPLWNETFAVPVLPSSDVLVFRVHNESAENLQSLESDGTERSANGSGGGGGARATADPRNIVGLCLLPVAYFDASGAVTRHKLEIFPRPNSPDVGSLYVAARIRRSTIKLLEKADLEDPLLRKQYHSSRLSAVTARFLGIGELAAFLFEEGYSADMNDNWDRALTLLAEQLAYRIWETTESRDDDANFLFAKRKVERDGGLWDGV